jgi:hypothetical protein
MNNNIEQSSHNPIGRFYPHDGSDIEYCQYIGYVGSSAIVTLGEAHNKGLTIFPVIADKLTNKCRLKQTNF